MAGGTDNNQLKATEEDKTAAGGGDGKGGSDGNGDSDNGSGSDLAAIVTARQQWWRWFFVVLIFVVHSCFTFLTHTQSNSQGGSNKCS